MRTLELYCLQGNGHWLLLATLEDDDPVTQPPFDAIGFPSGSLWGRCASYATDRPCAEGDRPVTSNAGGPALYLSSEHACSYLPGRQARTLFIDPLAPMSGHLYQHLLEHGFRRSGSHVYRPACGHCHACVPLRIPVAEFRPNRSQQRAWRRTRERLSLRELPPRFDSAHFALYRRYIEARHGDGSMADVSPESYEDFLLSPWGGETRLLELRLDERLMAVAVTDVLGNALSAVYTFFDPDLSAQAPGTLAVLCQASEAQRWGLDWLYLGYWIEECRKMSYKDRFRPVEAWIDGAWRPAERGAGIPWR